jgi:hypothetical protein
MAEKATTGEPNTADPNKSTNLANIAIGKGAAALDKLFAEVSAESPPVKPAEPEPSKPAEPEPSKDWTDEFQVSELTKPATKESFKALKAAAKMKLQEQEAALAAARAQVAELTTKTAKVMTPEQEAELSRLTKLEKTILIQTDDYFKTTFDAPAVNAAEAIYAKLLQAGMSSENIQKMKDLGGPTQVDWEKLYPSMQPSAKRFIDAKLVEIENLGISRTRAVEDAKKNADVFLQQRQLEREHTQKSWSEAVQKTTAAHLSQVDWYKPKVAPATATPDEKLSVEQHNQFLTEVQNAVKDFLADNSPETKALLILGTVQAFRRKAELDVIAADYKKLRDRAEKAETELNKIKKSSAIARGGHAPPASQTPAPRVSILTRGSEALDAIRDQVVGKG